MNAENAEAFFCPALLCLLHNPHGCGECRYCIRPWMACSRATQEAVAEAQISVTAVVHGELT